MLANGFLVFTVELQSAAFTLGNSVFTPHRLSHAHRSEKRRHNMQSPRNHLRALVKRIMTFGILSVVFFTAAVATGLAGGTAALASTQTYTITDLGTLGTTTVGYGINVNGQIAGRSYLLQTVPGHGCPPRRPCRVHIYHAFLYSAGQITDLGTLGGTFSDARAVNSSGDVAGISTLSGTSTIPTHAFLSHNGTMTDLGTLTPGGGDSHAYGINDLSEVVGDSYTASGQHDAFLYSGGKMMDLGALGALGSSANGINNSHQVVGSSEVPNGSGVHAFLWSNGKMTDLGTLGGSQSIAYAINTSGQVVGYASPPNSSVHAFLYSGGKMTDLGVFFDSSVAEAINTSGVVVGQADVLNSNGNTSFHAFIYSGGKLQDLNNLIPSGSGWVLTEATSINDKGQIVCDAYNATTGSIHTFLLNPI
jgi:probable HAF family extracellular repeat protein